MRDHTEGRFDDRFTKSLLIENNLKDTVDARPGLGGTSPMQEQCATEFRANYRYLVEQRIEFHNRRARELSMLLRSLPQEMSREAEAAMYILLTEGKW